MNQTESINDSIAYARSNQERFLEEFKELLRIPSISTDPAYKGDIRRAAEWVAAHMRRIGLENVQVIPTQGHPAVYGEWLGAGKDAPTILFYAHYDVQPVDPLELWESPPFEPQVREDKLYARGVVDDKCGVIVHLQACESILKTAGVLLVNLKLIFEGEEESGSPSMDRFVRENKELLKADLLVSSDGGNDEDQPKAFSALRGIVDAEVTVNGPVKDLHSGTYGGVVHNPIHLTAKMIATFHDDQGRILIPGFYDQVKPLSASRREYLKGLEAYTIAKAVQESGHERFWGPPEYSFLERQTARPTLEVNGIYGGYQGAGNKTIIPAQAGFKVSMRLVPNQDPEDIGRKFVDFIQSFACDTLDIQVETMAPSWPAEVLFEGPPIEALQRSVLETWGKPVMLYPAGGSIPVMSMFQRHLGMPITNLGFGNGENIHSPNEFYRLKYYYLGIETAIRFYYYIAKG